MQILIALIAGVVFGLGILISGMASPAKVLNFFDIAGTWDPSLMFVMGGALVVTFIGYRLAFARNQPLFAGRFHLPTRSDIDAKLVAGSAIFGVGWGISGFCPGAALPALGTWRADVAIFVAAMLVGIIATKLVQGMMAPPADSQVQAAE